MGEFFGGLGIVALVILALVGAGIGWLAGKLTGHSEALYALIGAVAAVLTPFVLALFGVALLTVGGVLLVVVVGAVGAALVVAAVRGMSGRRG